MSCRVALALLCAVVLLCMLATAQPVEEDVAELDVRSLPDASDWKDSAVDMPSIADVHITAVSGCVEQHPVTVNCSGGGTTTLRIHTEGFPVPIEQYGGQLHVDARLASGDTSEGYFRTSKAWADSSDPTGRSVFFTVNPRVYDPRIAGALVAVNLVDLSKVWQPRSRPFAGFSYRFSNPPTLTSISGCDGSGQSTLNCEPKSAVLTLTGSGLLWFSAGSGVGLNIGDVTPEPWQLINLEVVVDDSHATLSFVWLYLEQLKPHHRSGALLPLSLSSVTSDRSGRTEYPYTTNSLHLSFAPARPSVDASADQYEAEGKRFTHRDEDTRGDEEAEVVDEGFL